MTRVGQAGIEGPEGADESYGLGGYWFGEVAARGGDGTHQGDRAGSVGGAEHASAASALVELSQAGCEVGGVPLLGGHLFEAAAYLPEGLGPPARRVCDEDGVVAHIA